MKARAGAGSGGNNPIAEGFQFRERFISDVYKCYLATFLYLKPCLGPYTAAVFSETRLVSTHVWFSRLAITRCRGDGVVANQKKRGVS